MKFVYNHYDYGRVHSMRWWGEDFDVQLVFTLGDLRKDVKEVLALAAKGMQQGGLRTFYTKSAKDFLNASERTDSRKTD